MSERETILRIAAKGDGVTPSGRHVKGAVPGDTVNAEGIIERGPHHVDPPCPHFERCGGCQLQHADEQALGDFVTSRVVNAAQGQALSPGTVLPVHLSPPASRRRATLHAMRTAKRAVVGFREGGSHRIVDLAECPVLLPELEGLIEPLRALIAAHGGKGAIDVQLAASDQGLDVALSHFPLEGLAATEGVLEFAQTHGLARLSIDQGYGAETMWEPEPVTVTLSGVPTGLPVGGFLQATRDAEARMIADAKDWLGVARLVADLFAGLGTFAFALADGRKVLAAEADRGAYLACTSAAQQSGRGVHALHRDLFRNPLQPEELDRFDAVVLDPPRAGAKAQIEVLAASKVERVVYVSCNPSSWARDAARLTAAGFRLGQVRPIGQFRWSTHVELTSVFTR